MLPFKNIPSAFVCLFPTLALTRTRASINPKLPSAKIVPVHHPFPLGRLFPHRLHKNLLPYTITITSLIDSHHLRPSLQ